MTAHRQPPAPDPEPAARAVRRAALLTRWFVLAAGAFFLGCALERFLILFRDSGMLSGEDPLLGIPLKLGVLLIGGVEAAAAALFLFGARPGLQTALAGWLAMDHFLLRVGMRYMGIHPDWTFAGTLTDPLHLGRGWTGFAIGYVLPAGILAASLAALFWSWFRPVAPPEGAFAKMTCPECGRHIRFAAENLGRQVPCPQCQASVTLRRPGTLKAECHFCKGHVDFPDHALGRRIDCPHCRRGIVLQEMEKAML